MSFTDTVNNAINEFCRKMTQPHSNISDAVATVRIIGEFSAGKTRFVRELFGSSIPAELLPISSIERQTFVPLEITFGEKTRLTLIEKPADESVSRELVRLDRFPERTGDARQFVNGIEVKQGVHRFRLEIPEPHFIMPEGDKYYDNSGPQRFSLIDMPGWNSGNSGLEENPEKEMLGEHNIAVVYVARAGQGVEHECNKKHIESMVALCAENAIQFLIKRPVIYYIITHCPKNEQTKFVQRELENIKDIFEHLNMDTSSYVLHVKAYDLKEMTPDEKTAFQNHFWSAIFESTGTKVGFDFESAIRRWPEESGIGKRLKKIIELFTNAQHLLDDLKHNGKYIEYLNRTRLLNLGEKEKGERAVKLWQRQLGDVSLPVNFHRNDLALPVEHPLYTWWQEYMMPGLEKILTPIEQFCEKEERILRNLPENTDDFEAYFHEQLGALYLSLQKNFTSSFALMLNSVSTLVDEPSHQVIATMLALSLLDAKYSDYRDVYGGC